MQNNKDQQEDYGNSDNESDEFLQKKVKIAENDGGMKIDWQYKIFDYLSQNLLSIFILSNQQEKYELLKKTQDQLNKMISNLNDPQNMIIIKAEAEAEEYEVNNINQVQKKFLGDYQQYQTSIEKLKKVNHSGIYDLKYENTKFKATVDVLKNEIWLLLWSVENGNARSWVNSQGQGVPENFCKYLLQNWNDIAVSTDFRKVQTEQNWILRNCSILDNPAGNIEKAKTLQNLMNGLSPSGQNDFSQYKDGFIYLSGYFDTYGVAVNDKGQHIDKNKMIIIQFGSTKIKGYQYGNYSGSRILTHPPFGHIQATIGQNPSRSFWLKLK